MFSQNYKRSGIASSGLEKYRIRKWKAGLKDSAMVYSMVAECRGGDNYQRVEMRRADLMKI